MVSELLAGRVAVVRGFNRESTRVAGLITSNLLDTAHTLTEARVLWELGAGAGSTLADLRTQLGLDAGYLSRVISRLEGEGLLAKRRSDFDGRVQVLSLTRAGASARQILDRRSAQQVERLLAGIPEDAQRDLVTAMSTIVAAISNDERDAQARVLLRAPGPGDLGWIVERHGALYSREYGWGPGFEALIAEVVADYARNHPGAPESTAAWIAELGGNRAGSVVCMRDDARTARLRLLLVEPFARGHGIGEALVAECIRFARGAGYEELVLWTNEPLIHARPIYERAGFELVAEETHSRFGPEVVGQDWRLGLRTRPRR